MTVSNAGVSTAGLQAAYDFDEGRSATAWSTRRQLQDRDARWAATGRAAAATAERSPSTARTARSTRRARHVLQDRLHPRGVGLQADEQDRRGVVGSWARARAAADDLGRPHHRPLPADARRNVRQLPRLRADARDRPLAARRRDLRRDDRPHLHRRRAGRELAFTGNVGDSNTWRIGAYGSTAGGFFDGLIDDVRIYNRALSADRDRDRHGVAHPAGATPPTVTAFTPASGTTGVSVGSSVTATFSEPMQPSTSTSTRSCSRIRPGTPSRRPSPTTRRRTRDAEAARLRSLRRPYYRAVQAAGGVDGPRREPARRRRSWSFTTEASPPPVLVVARAPTRSGCTSARSCATRGWTRSRRSTLAPLEPAC